MLLNNQSVGPAHIRCLRHGLIARPIYPSNGEKRFFLFFPCFFAFLSVLGFFFVFFMSLGPVCIVAHHHIWHFPSSLATLSHICFADISNLGKSIRSPPTCGVAIVQVHRVLVVGRDWQGLLSCLCLRYKMLWVFHSWGGLDRFGKGYNGGK